MPFEKLQPIIAWLAPILSTLIVTAATASINAKIAAGERKRDEAKAETEAERRERAEWRAKVDQRMNDLDGKLDTLNDATQTNMRTTLIHYCEKYLERGWVTPEERASIWDMHKKYSALNANGFIDSYISRVMELPDKEI